MLCVFNFGCIHAPKHVVFDTFNIIIRTRLIAQSRQSFPLQLLIVTLIPSVLNIPTRLVMLVHTTVRIGNVEYASTHINKAQNNLYT